MDDDLYDEFGNFIGEIEEGSDSGSENGVDEQIADSYLAEEGGEVESGENDVMDLDVLQTPSAVVLHQDKRYYPSASEVFGEDVEVLVQERDTQALSEPIIPSIKVKTFAIEEENLPVVKYSREFQTNLMSITQDIRNIGIVGHLHHGKTSLLDMLVAETHDLTELDGKKLHDQLRYTDTHTLETQRGISINSSPMSLVLPNSKGKSFLVNVIDTPGHVDFIDEVAAASRLVDGLVVVVDVVEGLMINTKKVLAHAVGEGISVILVVNKLDRLILELRLPPLDAFFKIRHCIEEVNDYIASISTSFTNTSATRLSPELGNVVFASASTGWCFTLDSFANMYAQSFTNYDLDVEAFSKRLWGSVYFNPDTGKYSRTALESSSKLSFVYFILEPLYKLYAHTISKDENALRNTLAELNITLKPSTFKLDAKPLLRTVCSLFFGDSSALVDTLVSKFPSPLDNASLKTKSLYTGPQDSPIAQSLAACDPSGPLVVQITKLYSSPDALHFHAFGRVMSGTLHLGDSVRVLGESYSLEDEEDMQVASVSDVWINQTRYKIPIEGIPAGNWALIGGVDSAIVKSATIIADNQVEDAYIFKPLKCISQPVFKVAVEPLDPSELPKMLDGLRKVNKSYVLLVTKVEESGEHVILGSGELYLDCVLHDIRTLYADMEIKVSDPVTKFSETCIETSAIKCYAETPNKRNKITIIAEPLDPAIGQDIETGRVSINWPVKQVGKFFQQNYDWDMLSSRSIWAFGPDEMGPNILQDDTLPGEVDKKLLSSARESIRQGFQWSVREGPLCEEPIRNARFKIIDTVLAAEPIYRGGGQIIPTARRACYSAFLMASPRLLEPVYACYITCPGDAMAPIYQILERRRGNVVTDKPIVGTPLYLVQGQLPVIDSFGFETDVRVATQGSAVVSLVFDKWQIVPGDPMDRDQKVLPLQPSPASALARDFVLKTRRRKGLSDEPTITKYLDESLLASLTESGLLER